MPAMNNEWSITYPDSGYPFIAACSFQYMNSGNNGPHVAIKINSGQQISIYNQFQNGVYKGNGLEISFRGEKLKTCNYINIIMSIKSTDSSISKYGISLMIDTYFSNDGHQLKGLTDFRGCRGFDNYHYVDFIFNNSNKITPVSYAKYTGRSYFAKENPIDDKTVIPSTDGFTMTWDDRKISLGEVQEIRYSFGIGDYIAGYIVDVKTVLEKSYEPSSVISLNIDVSDNFFGDSLEVSRIIDSSTPRVVINEADTGNHFNFDDNFKLPSKIGYHKIKYIARNNQSVENEKEIEILVNNQPNITIFPEFFTAYNPEEKVSLNVSVFDDATVNIYLIIDGNTIISDSVECKSKFVSKIYDFSIPSGEIGSSHVMSIYCVDNYNIQSNNITQKYKLQITKPPEVKVESNISYLFNPNTTVEIFGEIKHFDETKRTCMYSAIDSKFVEQYDCGYISNDWTPFSFNRTIPMILGGIYKLNIICIDEYRRPYTTFSHSFAVVYDRRCTLEICARCKLYEFIQALYCAIITM